MASAAPTPDNMAPMTDDAAAPTAAAWLDAFGVAIGVSPPAPADIDHLLDLAGVAAHASERKAAPIACWMVAVAGLDASEALAVARTITPDPQEP